jgi:hypothetical protein
VGLESYALESRRRGVTDRTRSEDTEHEVIEEVLQVATTLRDMGRGENVRNGVGGEQTAVRTHAQCFGERHRLERARRPQGSWRLRVCSEIAAKGGRRAWM